MLTRHGSTFIALSDLFACPDCHHAIAYVLIGDALAVECQAERCGRTIPLDQMQVAAFRDGRPILRAPSEDARPQAVIPDQERICITPIDGELGLEYSAALDGYHYGIFPTYDQAELALTNWIWAERFGMVVPFASQSAHTASDVSDREARGRV